MVQGNPKLSFVGGLVAAIAGALSAQLDQPVIFPIVSIPLVFITVIGKEGLGAWKGGHVNIFNAPRDEVGEDALIGVYRRFGSFIGGILSGFIVLTIIDLLGVT